MIRTKTDKGVQTQTLINNDRAEYLQYEKTQTGPLISRDVVENVKSRLFFFFFFALHDPKTLPLSSSLLFLSEIHGYSPDT